MFNFYFADSYENRKVDNTVIENQGTCTVDTCSVNDGAHEYETGIEHPKYNNGAWVIVEAYDTKEDAQAGHNKWVGIMSAIPLPEKLVDCLNSEVAQFGDIFGLESEFPFQE